MTTKLTDKIENTVPKENLKRCNYACVKKEKIKTAHNYKHVFGYETELGRFYKGYINRRNNYSWNCNFQTEREAAIAVDKKLIEMGLEPVNILKKK